MESKKPIVLNNPVVKWAVHPADQGRIEYIDGMPETWPKLPHEGDVLTLPFLVDPQTRQPVPVRVVQIVPMTHLTPHVLAIQVSREH